MSQFAMALANHLKQFEWYGPGKNPLEISQRVADVCVAAVNSANFSDLHRMDGTITYVCRMVDRLLFMAAFPEQRTELNELLDNTADNDGVFPEGTKFKQGSAQGSGCATTSIVQTVRSTFNSFLGFRHARKPDGSRYTADEAFSALGIHLGDDGVDADLPAADHLWAAKKLGLVLEASIVPRGERGVNFLARYYSPDVWEGSLNSMCDVKRQLSKFHTTVGLPCNVRNTQKLVEKAMSYVATDGNTPVIGQLCRRAVSLSPALTPVLGIGSWWAKFEESQQYPNADDGEWMDHEFEVQFPGFDRSIFNNWLAHTNTLEHLLCPPLCAEIVPATPTSVDVIVDGDVVLARSSVPADPPAEDLPAHCDTTSETSCDSQKAANRKPRASDAANKGGPRKPRIGKPAKANTARKPVLKQKA